MTAAVSAAGLRKSYGPTTALSGVDLSVAPGEVLALIGPNGAGKTTLVRCLTGTTAPDAGEARLFDRPPREVDANRVGLLPQDFSPADRLSARELIAYYAGLFDHPRDVESVVRQVGLEEAADRHFRRLSGGERRRTLVGTAIVNDPDVLFLDEPTTGIDPSGRRAVWSLVEALAAGGTTVVLTTHSMAEAERLANRVGVLVDGRLAALGAPDELVAAHGGPRRLVVRTDDRTAALSALESHDPRAIDDGLTIDGLAAHELIPVIEALDAAGVGYRGLTWREPDLEHVYLELAGEAPQEPSSAAVPVEATGR